jgi:hypothetical protein
MKRERRKKRKQKEKKSRRHTKAPITIPLVLSE